MVIAYGKNYDDDGNEISGDERKSWTESSQHIKHRGQVRMAYRLADTAADHLMYVYGIGWHYWDGTRWAEDDQGAAERVVLQILKHALASTAGQKDTNEEAKALRRDVEKCESASGIAGVLTVASKLTAFARRVRDLDADPYLLNVANGTLDLSTMQLRPHHPGDLITKLCRGAYQPDASAPAWEKFLTRVLPDEDVRGYLQRFAGLSLLGKVREHILGIATGVGANGKGTAYGALLHTLGDYGHAAEPDLFMAARTNPNGAKPAAMGLRGKRFVVASELERGQALAEALMKNLTGGDPITARPLYGRPVTFDPSHTALMVTNHLPVVAGDDPAVWRRLRVIPFDVVIPEAERDELLGDQLQLEADGILTWAIGGWVEYQHRGMADPAAVKVATSDYQRQSDALARFLEERCLVGPHYHVTAGDLFDAWRDWCTDDGTEVGSKTAFGLALGRRGFQEARTNRARLWRGLALVNLDAGDEL